jgi:hypothetical protein
MVLKMPTPAKNEKLNCSRRMFLASLHAIALSTLAIPVVYARAADSEDEKALLEKFNHLSQNGNSSCSASFMKSISSMPAGARLQGSCCAPMDAHRYVEQIQSLRKYSSITEIPGDPYDVPADLARKLMSNYEFSLSTTEQAAYDYAMASSDEKGPCCCQCWRWHVYGGLGKLLIHEKGFDGPKVVEVWNLSSGCGGGAEHHR